MKRAYLAWARGRAASAETGADYWRIGLCRAAPRGDARLATFRAPETPEGLRFEAGPARLSDLLPQLPSDLSHVFVPYGGIDPEKRARDPAGTAEINVVSVIGVLRDALDAGLIPVFFSSDYVFSYYRA